MVGQTISHYKILSKLGEGGMGVVYKAEDTRLKRNVALKFLSANMLGDEDQKARFLREAQSAALLDHPNIAAVHDIGEAEGRTFMAIAFVDGPELATKIKERPLKLDEALGIASQICEGLKEAHEKGVTHRDIKPANIMLTKKGRVKITDFGLAHLAGRSKLTKSGTSLGTPAYMSPEQALGDPTDRRSDIWGVGVVLYEMIAGKIPFAHEHEQAIIYSIINEPPEPLTALRTGLPTELDRVIGKALAKKPEERYQHVDDFLVDLRRLGKSTSAETKSTTARPETIVTPAPTSPALSVENFPGPQPERPPSGPHSLTPIPAPAWKTWLPWAVSALLAVLLMLIWGKPIENSSTSPLRRFRFQPDHLVSKESGDGLSVSISPNGRYIAYLAGERDEGRAIWIQDLDREGPRRLDGSSGASAVYWSPDSEWILFGASQELKKIPVRGGPATPICDLKWALRGATVSPDGRQVVFSDRNPPSLYTVPFGGGEPRPFHSDQDWETLYAAFPDLSEVTLSKTPLFLPTESTAKKLIFALGQSDPTLLAQDLTSKRFNVLARGRGPAFSPSGHLLYEKEGDLWAARLSREDLAVVGDPFLVREDTGSPSVASDGTLVYVDLPSRLMQLSRVDRGGRPITTTGEPAEIVGTNPLTIAADAKRALYELHTEVGADIWMHDLQTGSRSPVTSGRSRNYSGRWSHDGSRVAFSSDRKGNYDIFIQEVGIVGEPQQLTDTPQREVVNDWSSDGRYLLYRVSDEEAGLGLAYLELDGQGEWIPHPYLNTQFVEVMGRFSPDGRYVSYQSNDSGRFDIYIRAFPKGDKSIPISPRGGTTARWSLDSGELFYLEGTTLMVVSVSTAPELVYGTPKALFPLPGAVAGSFNNRAWDVFPDGQSFVVTEAVGDTPDPSIRVVENWYEEFRDREQDYWYAPLG